MMAPYLPAITDHEPNISLPTELHTFGHSRLDVWKNLLGLNKLDSFNHDRMKSRAFIQSMLLLAVI